MTPNAAAGVSPHRTSPVGRRMMRHAAVGFAVAGGSLFATAAQAGCINIGRLWTCTEVGGRVEQMFCIGPGPVRSCQEFNGQWIFIGRHEVLSQVLADNELSNAAQTASRRAAQAGSSEADGDSRPSVEGNVHLRPGLGNLTPAPSSLLPRPSVTGLLPSPRVSEVLPAPNVGGSITPPAPSVAADSPLPTPPPAKK
jgi:hypothetical protein